MSAEKIAALKKAGLTWAQILALFMEFLKQLLAMRAQQRRVGCPDQCTCALECLDHALCIAQHQLEILQCCDPDTPPDVPPEPTPPTPPGRK